MADSLHKVTITIDGQTPFTIEAVSGAKIIITVDDDSTVGMISAHDDTAEQQLNKVLGDDSDAYVKLVNQIMTNIAEAAQIDRDPFDPMYQVGFDAFDEHFKRGMTFEQARAAALGAMEDSLRGTL